MIESLAECDYRDTDVCTLLAGVRVHMGLKATWSTKFRENVKSWNICY